MEVGADVAQFLIEQQAFADGGDIVVGEECLEVGLDGAVAGELLFFVGFVGEELAEVGLLEFLVLFSLT